MSHADSQSVNCLTCKLHWPSNLECGEKQKLLNLRKKYFYSCGLAQKHVNTTCVTLEVMNHRGVETTKFFLWSIGHKNLILGLCIQNNKFLSASRNFFRKQKVFSVISKILAFLQNRYYD